MNIIITGTSGDIGSAIKNLLLSNNINVIDINSNDVDLSHPFTVTYDRPIDGLIHCAGINKLSSYDKINAIEFYELFSINAYSFISLCQQLKFNSGANILAIGSIYAELVKEYRLQYSMSKSALLSAVKTLSLEMGHNNIKVNMISPGFVDTKMTRQNNTSDRINDLNSYIPLGLTNLSDIAELCLFFITKNNAITGQNIIIDGGFSCKTF